MKGFELTGMQVLTMVACTQTIEGKFEVRLVRRLWIIVGLGLLAGCIDESALYEQVQLSREKLLQTKLQMLKGTADRMSACLLREANRIDDGQTDIITISHAVNSACAAEIDSFCFNKAYINNNNNDETCVLKMDETNREDVIKFLLEKRHPPF